MDKSVFIESLFQCSHKSCVRKRTLKSGYTNRVRMENVAIIRGTCVYDDSEIWLTPTFIIPNLFGV